jgi:hypothetical protein
VWGADGDRPGGGYPGVGGAVGAPDSDVGGVVIECVGGVSGGPAGREPLISGSNMLSACAPDVRQPREKGENQS